MDISTSTVAITGAAGDFGRAFALDLAARGARLALIDLREDALDGCRAACAALGAQCAAYRADISNERQTMALFERIGAEQGGLDALVNNAGLTRDAPLIGLDPQGGLIRHPLAEWRRVIDANLTGSFLCAREAAALMIAGERGGVVVNISSVTRAGNAGQSGYSAAKAGIASLTVTWARELAAHGVRVAAIAPGYMDTQMSAGVSASHRQRLLDAIPAGRLGRLDEIVATLRFVLENDYVNGRVIEVDGGLRL